MNIEIPTNIEMLLYPIIFGPILMAVLLIIGMAVYNHKLSKTKKDMQTLLKEMLCFLDNLQAGVDRVSDTCAENILQLVYQRLLKGMGVDSHNPIVVPVSETDVEFKPQPIDDVQESKPMAAGTSMEELEDAFAFRSEFLEERFRGKDRIGSKCVVIRKSYHEMLRAVCRIAGNDELTMSGYLDNILTDHFNRYGTEIEAMASTGDKTNVKSL